jgi:hypothetical protein
MASTKYTYDKQVDAGRLTQEIQQSTIVTALDYITTTTAICDVWFKDALSEEDEGKLDVIVANTSPDPLPSPNMTEDGRNRVYDTVRPWGTRIMYMGQSDDITDPTKIGGGPVNKMVHATGGNDPQSMYIDFNTIINDTYAYLFMASFKDFQFDELTMTGVPRLTTVSSGSNTNYNTYGGYLIVPAAGNGTTVVADENRVLVAVHVNEEGVKPPAYWNADFNTTTKVFENITPAPAGDGWYNMFAAEVPLVNFCLKAVLNGTIQGWMMTPSHEADKIAHGVRLKISVDTIGDDHDWTFGVTVVCYRQKTI